MHGGMKKSDVKLTGIILAIVFLLFLPSFVTANTFTAKTINDYGNITVMEVTGNYDANNPDGPTSSIPRIEAISLRNWCKWIGRAAHFDKDRDMDIAGLEL